MMCHRFPSLYINVLTEYTSLYVNSLDSFLWTFSGHDNDTGPIVGHSLLCMILDASNARVLTSDNLTHNVIIWNIIWTLLSGWVDLEHLFRRMPQCLGGCTSPCTLAHLCKPCHSLPSLSNAFRWRSSPHGDWSIKNFVQTLLWDNSYIIGSSSQSDQTKWFSS